MNAKKALEKLIYALEHYWIAGKAFKDEIDAARPALSFEEPRFCIVSDDSGHDYYVPVDKRDQWPSNDDEFEDFELPDWAVRIDGHFTFTDPRCE